MEPDALGSRWLPFDQFVDWAAAVTQRPKKEIREWLEDIARRDGVSIGVVVIRRDQSLTVEPQKSRGCDVVAPSSLLDRDELQPLLEAEFGPFCVGAIADASNAQNAGPIDQLTRFYATIGKGEPWPQKTLEAKAKDAQIQFKRGESDAAYALAVEKGYIQRQIGSPKKQKQVKRQVANKMN